MSPKEEILSLLNHYAYAVDTGDLDGFAALYEKGEWYVEGTEPNRGSSGVKENVLSRVILYEDGTPKTRHITTNIEITVDESSGTARAQRYVTVIQGTKELPLQTIFAGHYHDQFAREGGRWHFKQTIVRNPLVGNMSHHLRSEDFIKGE